jgi:hypothetical protein
VGQTILPKRERIKRDTVKNRRKRKPRNSTQLVYANRDFDDARIRRHADWKTRSAILKDWQTAGYAFTPVLSNIETSGYLQFVGINNQ